MLTVLSVFALRAQDTSMDILITGAWVFDGTLNDSVQADVGIRDGHIVFIGDARHKTAKRHIDATGLYMTPGFIDPHTHTSYRFQSKDTQERANLLCLFQGVTTVFNGNDGSGPYPIARNLERWEAAGIGTNAALLIGQGTVRRKVMGSVEGDADSIQMQEMKKLVARGMQEGAYGISTGLAYVPGVFTSTAEIAELAKVVSKYGGIYDTHMRDQSAHIVESIEETLEIGRAAGIPVHISHIKVSGESGWGRSSEIIDLIEGYRERGVDITANLYPYEASRTSLRAMRVPDWALEGGTKAMLARFDDPKTAEKVRAGIAELVRTKTSLDRMFFSKANDPFLRGKSVLEVIQAWGTSPEEAIIRILKNQPGVGANLFSMQEQDIINFMRQPWMMTGSDGGTGHPRAAGAFAKRIRKYVLDKPVTSMKMAVHASSGLTAETFGITKRGFIREGYYADIVLLDPEQYRDQSDFNNPMKPAMGVQYVLVNGTLAIDEGKYTGALAGKALRKTEN